MARLDEMPETFILTRLTSRSWWLVDRTVLEVSALKEMRFG